eukprot:TRINITY_DN108_c0_g1_i6.p2 TRINITY_DN108_c0_g1~~TRINITY_DN108_c0_g1_i6.p2  ORF type:complete len:149 (-),score=20.51 TRINITY_DN108_c0_g1_i6:94-540(-)
MVTSVVIIILSLAMFVYWFRYSCILILESSWNEEQAQVIALQNKLSFGSVNESLAQAGSAEEMDRVKDLLDRDLGRMVSLLSTRPEFQEAGHSLECRMLMLDYQIMKAWYAATRTIAGPKAQQALREMAQVVGYMAGEYGDHLATARN